MRWNTMEGSSERLGVRIEWKTAAARRRSDNVAACNTSLSGVKRRK